MCVVSLGGNALIRRGDKGTIEEQFAHTRACTKQISRMVMDGFRIVITHGNGPIVGNIVIRNEAARNTIPPMPLYICVARELGAECIINLTQVDSVYVNYGREGQRALREVGLEDIGAYYEQGHFPPGSMGPKIEAAIGFLRAGGKEVIITSPELVGEAMEGRAGTRLRAA